MTISSQSVAVITGAGSGIGRALALGFASEGVAGIAISDWNEQTLRETALLLEEKNVPFSSHVIDTSSLAQMERLRDDVIQHHGRATHLFNNAGVGLMGTFEHISLEDFEWLMGINFWGVVYGCRVFLPIFREQPQAHIINISSVFGIVAPPEQTAYCASKFAVRGFTESLRHELEETNVRVSSVHPGGIATNIARNSRLGEKTPRDYQAQAVKFFDKVAKTTPETAAATIIQGVKSENPRILIGSDAKAINVISRLFPRKYLSVIEKIAGHRLDLRKKS
jgi:NAD(P)-dependent dehydrogenase (short-subunit alcohol dehydrogenase family)